MLQALVIQQSPFDVSDCCLEISVRLPWSIGSFRLIKCIISTQDLVGPVAEAATDGRQQLDGKSLRFFQLPFITYYYHYHLFVLKQLFLVGSISNFGSSSSWIQHILYMDSDMFLEKSVPCILVKDKDPNTSFSASRNQQIKSLVTWPVFMCDPALSHWGNGNGRSKWGTWISLQNL